MARLIHRLRSDDPGQHFALLQAARRRLSAGGARRLRHTLPPIAFAALDIVRRLAAAGPASGEPSQKEVRRLSVAGVNVQHCVASLVTAAYSSPECHTSSSPGTTGVALFSLRESDGRSSGGEA